VLLCSHPEPSSVLEGDPGEAEELTFQPVVLNKAGITGRVMVSGYELCVISPALSSIVLSCLEKTRRHVVTAQNCDER